MKKIVLITSVIEFKNKPLSYSDTRSVFSPDERLQQTKDSIKSVREKISDAVIVLCELGCDQKLSIQLKPLVDHYYYVGDNYLIRKTVDSCFKGLGEAVGLLFISKSLRKLKFDVLLKLSGRYYLNDDFNENYWNISKGFMAKKDKKTMSTRLYGFSRQELNLWIFCLIFSLPFLFLNLSIERILLILLNSKIKHINKLGVSGLIAVNNCLIDE